MRALLSPGRDLTWLHAVATLSLCVSLLTGRYQGHTTDFISGFFLGLSLALCLFYLVVLAVRPRRAPP